ncbi:MAG TPA: M15 family metallopeptidase [Ramlibacter sp.]|uniref:M15 family metallopeptidase n=1 Tax=Ramlibacter sp. TaxID=1917967 RepID=UPI002CE6AB3E|nr:M15 family metallopeptidase [Ramlibacter sp.]HVZ46678.1 M15 family metallopeptidase [Ramlibacter sp.]
MSHNQIPVEDCGEPLVDVAVEGGLLIGPPPETPLTEPDYRWVRRTVYEKLLRVQENLPRGLSLRLYEGLRSAAVQHRLFEEEKARVAIAHPRFTPRQVHLEASLLIAPPVHFDGTPNIPPHSTGGAVDVEIVDESGSVIEFGMEAKDWVRVDARFCETRHEDLTPEARANRLMLCERMEAEGFVNYVREWWHYSYGDRYWAWMSGAPKAIYGPVSRP